MLNTVANNVWAFGLFVIAAAVAVTAAAMHDADLMKFAGLLVPIAGVMFQGGDKKQP